MDDQTEVAWLRTARPMQVGTGILLVPHSDPERRGRFEAIDFADLTHAELQLRAIDFDAVAMKWIPNTVADYTTLRLSACGAGCTDTCVTKGCICDKSIGRCVKAT